MNKSFQLFQKYFKKYQKQFGLLGYKVYFKYEPIDGAFATIIVDQTDMTATARLNSKLPDDNKQFQDVQANAKHEALHLLINRIQQLGRDRYTTEVEITEASEELVRKLEVLVKG